MAIPGQSTALGALGSIRMAFARNGISPACFLAAECRGGRPCRVERPSCGLGAGPLCVGGVAPNASRQRLFCVGRSAGASLAVPRNNPDKNLSIVLYTADGVLRKAGELGVVAR